nr:HDOD domain-containing protein [candidate division Zixibacteria bacterium]
MSADFMQKILEASPNLTSLPQTMVEVLRLARDESSSSRQMAQVIMHDTALAAKVLRVVNSPFYGRGQKIGNITDAVTRMGLREVTALALSTSVYRMTGDWKSSLDRARFWRHSLEVAIAARLIAEKVNYKNSEEMFVAGLLHDLGLLVLEQAVPDEFSEIWLQAGAEGNLIELENRRWETNHALVGEYLLEQWHLPESISTAVGRHHSIYSEGADQPMQLSGQIVNLGHMISKFGLISEMKINTRILVGKEIIRANIGIPADELLAIEKTLFSRTMEESRYLEIDIGSIDDIIMEANQLLFEQYVTIESMNRVIRKMEGRIKNEKSQIPN